MDFSSCEKMGEVWKTVLPMRTQVNNLIKMEIRTTHLQELSYDPEIPRQASMTMSIGRLVEEFGEVARRLHLGALAPKEPDWQHALFPCIQRPFLPKSGPIVSKARGIASI